MITALFMSLALATTPSIDNIDRETAQLVRMNALMDRCIEAARAKSISRARRECRASLDYALTVSAPDEETIKTIAVFVQTLNTTDLRAQGWTD